MPIIIVWASSLNKGGRMDPLKLGIIGGMGKICLKWGGGDKQEMGELIWVGGRLMILHQLFIPLIILYVL